MNSESSAAGKSGRRDTKNSKRHVAPFWNVEQQHQLAILEEDLMCDTVIVGGGIAGLSVGYALAKAGRQPVVIEAASIGEGSTGWCGGILSSSTTIDLQLVEEAFGKQDAIRLFSALAETLHSCRKAFPDVDWQSGSSFYLAAKEAHRKILQVELESKERYGTPMRLRSRSAMPRQWKGFSAALETESEHAAHPIKLLDAIAFAMSEAGGKLFEHSAMTGWHHDQDHFVLKTTGGTIKAKHLVLCGGLSGAGFSNLKEYQKLLMPASGHIIVTQPSDKVRQLVADTGVIAAWDSLNLYHYVRYLADGRMLIGGEEAAGSIPAKAVGGRNAQSKNLLKWAREHHNFDVPEIECAWKASLIIPADGLPVIQSETYGVDNRLVKVITDGLPFAMLIGESVGQMLMTGESWLAKLLDGKRPVPLSSKILSLMPESQLIRKPAYRAAFLALRLYDAFC